MNQIDQQIGHKVKIKRRKLGITQAHLSKKLSISPAYLNLMESGKRKIDFDLLLKIANELNVDISDISKKTDTNLYQNLMDLLGDNLFENLDITNFDVKELVNTNPSIAKVFSIKYEPARKTVIIPPIPVANGIKEFLTA